MIYSIAYSTQLDVTGTYPQVKLSSDVFKENKHDFKILNSEKLPDGQINLNGFILDDKALKTDILSSDELNNKIGLFLSKKAYDILKTIKSHLMSFYPIKINNQEYFFLQVVSCHDLIDYQKSLFKDMINSGKIEKVESYKDYALRRSTTYLKAQEIFVLNSPQLFRVPFDAEILITEELKNSLEKADLSGMNIKPYTNFIINT